MDLNFWRDKKVFITGHTGFKGSWLSLWLRSLKADITGYSIGLPAKSNIYESARIDNQVQSNMADIRDLFKLTEALQSSKPEIVIHMAAQPLVRHSYDAPIETYSINVIGTANLLEAIRKTPGVKSVVIVTTDKCYENKEWLWGYRENEPLGGYDPYSSSKACAELVTSAYRNSFFNKQAYQQHGVAIASARAGNVIGGGDWSRERLIPDLITAIENNKPAKIRMPDAIRPWQYVLEALRGYLVLAEKLYKHGPVYAEAWNFGPAEHDIKSVKHVANMLTAHWANNSTVSIDKQKELHEANCLKLDSTKANTKLGWKQAVNLEYAINSIVHWHKAFNDNMDMNQVTLEQISNYQQLICKVNVNNE